ncbi:hypothetical protein ACFL0Q_00940 [Thermodesulfobacteriota bacterium]
MSTVRVNTVTGPISPEDLGITLMHEHIVFGYPGWYGDATMAPFDMEAAVTAGVTVLEELKSYGLRTFVDATPNETEGTMGPDQAELLVSAGADPKRIVIGHISDNTDVRYHLNTLNKGVYVAFD